ncbi:hypothetical protein [Pelagicoccus sp. SDUM812003]|uniref:hypothetical protein n=1 Tax=Pelagicoccus sp. SDUM812003 TaxID=3041267 RepID=UPI00280F718F|nr:hypothetical protein [Pelagicoccus sp. SDUM812003]MDQ8204998.1 hypothetical protein [Pelagicoccus sp. SDUM812003]
MDNVKLGGSGEVLQGVGYKIEIKRWIGGFANNIIQLSNAVNVAKGTASLLVFPEHSIFRSRELDFRSSENVNCDNNLLGDFFLKEECFQFALDLDSERREILLDYIRPLIFTAEQLEQVKTPDLAYDLVIHVRSGDVFRDDWKSEDAITSGVPGYVQPPLAYYERILDGGDYKSVLLVTQPDMKNPVISELLKRDNVSLKKHGGRIEDIITFMRAKELVIGHSTFSWCSALMSSCLKRLHQPCYFKMKGVDGIEILSYSFPGYIERGDWNASPRNMKKMLGYGVDNVQVRSDEVVQKEEGSGSECGAVNYVYKYTPPLIVRLRKVFRLRSRLKVLLR